MAWTAVNPVAIGDAMKQPAHWAVLWANGDYLYTFINARTIWIFEDTAPSGWAIVAATGDGLLAVKGGTAAYNVAGGTALQGTWTQPTHTHTGGAHTHATEGVAITESTMPAHTHAISPAISLAAVGGDYVGTGASSNFGAATDTELFGSTQDHDHGDTGSAGDGGQSGASASANTWRPVANVGILIVHS